MAIGSRLRFEILRRDGFRCSYCGAKPQQRELHVDHVVAKTLGGTDTPENLASSCQDCNLGKASTTLEGPAVTAVDQRAVQYREAISSAAQIQVNLREGEDRFVGAFRENWDSRATDHDLVAPPEPGWESGLLRFLRLGVPEEELHALTRVAMDAHRVPGAKKWTYFCGCCWRAVEELRQMALCSVAEATPEEASSPEQYEDFAIGNRAIAEAQAMDPLEAVGRAEHLADLHPVFSEFVRTGEISRETQVVADTLRWRNDDRVLEYYFTLGEPRGAQDGWPQVTRWSPEPVGLGPPDGLMSVRVPVAEVLYNPGTTVYRLSPTLVGREIRPESCAVIARIFGGNSQCGIFWDATRAEVERYANPGTSLICVYDPADSAHATLLLVSRFWTLREHELPDDHWSLHQDEPDVAPITPRYQPFVPLLPPSLPNHARDAPEASARWGCE